MAHSISQFTPITVDSFKVTPVEFNGITKDSLVEFYDIKDEDKDFLFTFQDKFNHLSLSVQEKEIDFNTYFKELLELHAFLKEHPQIHIHVQDEHTTIVYFIAELKPEFLEKIQNIPKMK